MPVILRWLLRLGPANPIAVRLVQNGSKRTRHLYIRTVYLAVLIIVLLWMLLINTNQASLDYRGLALAGASSFTKIAYLQVFLICVLSPVFMGGAIAQEANPRTWEVLLTTPMTASEIVLGNLFGRLFFVLALLMASLPLFALTQYFGGVPGKSIFASYLVAATTALLVGGIAIALSVSRLVGKRAFFVFYVGVVTYLAVTIALDLWLRGRGLGAPTPSGNDGVTWMTALNPFLALSALLNPTAYARWPEGTYSGVARWFLEMPVTTWCVGSSLLTLVFVGASTLTVRSGGLATLASDEAGVPLWRTFLRLPPKGAQHRAPKSVWHNPVAWREAASRNATPGKIALKYLFLAAGAAFGVGIVVLYHTGKMSMADFRFALLATLWAELTIIALVAINVSATAISKEREDGTLDLLLTTPITPSAYLTGKLRGLVQFLLPLLAVPFGTLLAGAAYAALGGFGRAALASETSTPAGGAAMVLPTVLPEAALLAPIVVIPFMAFCVMVGLQWSLKSRGILGSVVATVGVVGVISGVVGLCAWKATGSVPYLGPALGALSPASMLYASVEPFDGLNATLARGGAVEARASLAVGCLVAGAIWAGVCYGIHSNMVRTFDMTVRKLAGQR